MSKEPVTRFNGPRGINLLNETDVPVVIESEDGVAHIELEQQRIWRDDEVERLIDLYKKYSEETGERNFLRRPTAIMK